jgi:hypothetical protein
VIPALPVRLARKAHKVCKASLGLLVRKAHKVRKVKPARLV